jgi:cytoskeletal protein CcmA (bactofilin family)
MSESQDTHTSVSSRPGWTPGTDTPASVGSDHSLIGPTVVIKGEVTAEENLMVMGRVEGFIDHSKTVTIHAQGTVAAEVKAEEVLVEGTVDGNVYGTKRVQIAETGNVNGNVYAPRVGVLEGASFKGAIDMDADADAIERRFREKTGTESVSKEAVEKEVVEKEAKSSKSAKGDNDAGQTEEKGPSDNVSGEAGESAE